MVYCHSVSLASPRIRPAEVNGVAGVADRIFGPGWRTPLTVVYSELGLLVSRQNWLFPQSLSCRHGDSSFRSPRLDLESRSRNLARVGMHRDIHPQPGEGTSYDPAGEVEILRMIVACQSEFSYKQQKETDRFAKRTREKDGGEGRPKRKEKKKNEATHSLSPTQRLLRGFDAGFAVDAHAADGLEALVCQHEDAAVVCLEVVDLLAEEQGPQIFADELDVVEGGLGAGAVGAESVFREENGRVSVGGLFCCSRFGKTRRGWALFFVGAGLVSLSLFHSLYPSRPYVFLLCECVSFLLPLLLQPTSFHFLEETEKKR